ncbi:SMI1/KNR4 family protein [Paenibacillus thailandensis]|uniref:SMI1/KNR4 family protein n=1 Tax=Paenibacillus thailandensis TaxID=393250 RepID=A0ABW5R2Y1_9BACL
MKSSSLVRETLNGLTSILEINKNFIYILDGNGEVGKYTCKFNRGVTEQEIEDFKTSTGLVIPGEYIEFLKITNGCDLFNHELYGGENTFYPIDQVDYLYNTVYKINGLLQIAYISGDWIVIDCKKYSSGDEKYMHVVNSAASLEDDLRCLGCNFETWFNRYIATNGKNYWSWK